MAVLSAASHLTAIIVQSISLLPEVELHIVLMLHNNNKRHLKLNQRSHVFLCPVGQYAGAEMLLLKSNVSCSLDVLATSADLEHYIAYVLLFFYSYFSAALPLHVY